MTIQELIAAAATKVVNQEEIEALKCRLAEAEKKFEDESRSKAASQAFLARTYSL